MRNVSACVALLVCMECACSRSAQCYLDRGKPFFDSGKYADAGLQYRKSISRDPKLAEAYYRLGLAEFQLQQVGEAFLNLQRAVGLNPTSGVYRVQLANISLLAYQANPSNQQLYTLVAQEADRLLNANPNSFDGLRLEGDIRLVDRKPDQALSLFERADALQPFDPNVRLPMVQALFALGRDKEAEAMASQSLSRRKDLAPMYDLLL